MTKNQALQKELQEKVIPGVKPSDLKKLKRSKSADDITNIPVAPPLPNNQLVIEKLQQQFNSQLQQINCLFDPNAINYTQPINFNGLYQHLKEILTISPPQPLLLDQLKEKQKEIENLRKQLEQVNHKLTETTAELDNSLEVRHQSLKDWNKQQEAIKSLNQELNETINQASEEIVQGDDEISSLRTKINQLKTAKESLERDLKLASRLAEIRKVPLPDSSDNFTEKTLPTSFYALLALAILFLASNITVSVTAQEK